MSTPPPSSRPSGDELGPAPKVAGRERIRAGARAKLFGPEPDADGDDGPAEDSSASDTAIGEPVFAEDPQRLGRFRVLQRLGEGGMGVVYAAYDPQLDRKVALKVLRPDLEAVGGEDARTRLVREARAMAKLSHPNVVTVHEVGTVDDRVFIAMEYVDGPTLRGWLTAAARPWREVVAKFRGAGLGLAAAHAAGLVHRDFKPDNVLLTPDGRPQVVDFGLARRGADGPDRSMIDRTEPERASASLRGDLTRTGSLMGTPAYMAPEQLRGGTADARSDQFAFCVALYEALYGHRPFAGNSLNGLMDAVLGGHVLPAPTDARVPRWLRLAVLRGLAIDPGDRYPAIDDLLVQLRRDPARRLRRIAAAVGLVAVGGSVAVAVTGTGGRDGDECARVGRALDGIWDEPTVAAVASSLKATELPYADKTWNSARRLLDAYAQRWTELSGEACAAALVPGYDQAEHEKRVRCLDVRRAELEQLVGLLRDVDRGMAQMTVQAAASLTDPAVCADPRRLEAWQAPRNPEIGNRLAAARGELARAKAQGALGHYDKAIRAAQEVVIEAHELDDPATEAAALLVRGQFQERSGDRKESEQSLRDSASRAEIAGDHGTRVLALSYLIYVISRDPDRYEEAKALGTEAKAVLKVIGADELLQSHLDNSLGAAARSAHSYEVALEHHQHALASRMDRLGREHPDTASSLANIGTVLYADKRADEAIEYLERALAGFEEVLGGDHPLVAVALSNLANARRAQGRATEAVRLHRRSLEIRRRVLGTAHRSVAPALYNLANALIDARAYEDSVTTYQDALRLRTAIVAPDHQSLTGWYYGLGRAAAFAKQAQVAEQALQQALQIVEKDGDGGTTAALIRFEIARAIAPTRRDEALEMARAAAQVFRDEAPDDDDLPVIEDWLLIQGSLDALSAAG